MTEQKTENTPCELDFFFKGKMDGNRPQRENFNENSTNSVACEWRSNFGWTTPEKPKLRPVLFRKCRRIMARRISRTRKRIRTSRWEFGGVATSAEVLITVGAARWKQRRRRPNFTTSNTTPVDWIFDGNLIRFLSRVVSRLPQFDRFFLGLARP